MSGQTNEKEEGWLLPQRRKNAVTPGLYLVATPIGNLGDITLRALDVLAACDRVICEDTRVSGKLLEYFGIKKPLLPYNDHNAAKQRGPVLQMLRDGQRVAFISDAGTPLVSDPGYKLVRECIEEGIAVTAIPGANAPLMALQLSGLPCDAFSFIGFLPPKSAARKKHLSEWKNAPGTLIAF
jgi:16S rRNA (cytidine1402-2'-O)-methyltransferase